MNYREFLVGTLKLARGKVCNKIGFVCTLINSGHDSAKYAKYLPANHFEKIKVKRAKRGNKRLPFHNAELQTIFGSTVYMQGECAVGGGGEAAVWIPAIAYLSGMRLEEIASLHCRQFQTDAAGNPYIHVEGRQALLANGRRKDALPMGRRP